MSENKGWTCPKCNTIWSPNTKKCETCEPKPTTENVDGTSGPILLTEEIEYAESPKYRLQWEWSK